MSKEKTAAVIRSVNNDYAGFTPELSSMVEPMVEPLPSR